MYLHPVSFKIYTYINAYIFENKEIIAYKPYNKKRWQILLELLPLIETLLDELNKNIIPIRCNLWLIRGREHENLEETTVTRYKLVSAINRSMTSRKK